MPKRIISIGYNRAGLTLRNWVLERAGYEVLSASTVKQSLELLRTASYDLVIVAGSIPPVKIMHIVSASKPDAPILWLFIGPREDLPGITDYMPLLDGPEELLEHVRRLLAQPKPVERVPASTEEARPERRGVKSPYLVFADGNRRLVEATEDVCRLLGYERSELLRMKVEDITAPGTAQVPEFLAKFADEGFQEGSYVLKHRNGKQIPIHYRAKIFPDGAMAAEWFPAVLLEQRRSRRRA
jgi:PAS domain S-box-containing protein